MARIAATAAVFAALAVVLTACGAGQTERMKPAWTVGGAPEERVRYWTPERMARAVPYRAAAARSGDRAVSKLRYTSRAWGNGPVTVEGARSVGKVFFDQGGVPYYCTGTAINSENASVVATAGHCAADGGTCAKGSSCRPHENWIFVPAFRQGAACRTDGEAGCPYGRYAAKALFAPEAWLRDGNNRYDVAAVVVEARDKEFALASTAGGIPIAFDLPPGTLVQRDYSIFGYPNGAPFNGRLWVCEAKRAARTGPEGGPAGLTAGCDMTGGADGGPWLTKRNGRTVVAGVTNSGAAGTRATVSGTYLGDIAKQIFDLALATKVES
jgi:V8-like Glu-specific endopeptidase